MRGITPDFSRPGKPTDNAFIESFSDEVPERQRQLVPSLDEARQKCEAWRSDHDEVRRHNAIGQVSCGGSSIGRRPARRLTKPGFSTLLPNQNKSRSTRSKFPDAGKRFSSTMFHLLLEIPASRARWAG